MAYADGFTGDATSGIGQGLAYILPQSKAVAYAAQLAQTHASQLNALAKQKQAMQLKSQEQYQNDFKDQKLPEAFAPFDKELNDRQNKWLQDGAKQYATTGKNPFNDPEFMARHNTEILTPARQSQELGQNYTKLRAIAETDPTNKYTKESKQAVIDYEQKIKDDPFSVIDKPLPKLQETPATADDLIKTLKPVKKITDNGNWQQEGPDSSAHKAQAFAALVGDPKWHPLLQKYGYNPDLPDFGVYTDPTHPNGKRVWYTNPTFTGQQADEILSTPEEPRSKDILQKIGIDPVNDKYAKEKLEHVIGDQNAAMGKAVTDIAGRKDAEVEDKTTYTGRLDNKEDREQFHADLQSQRQWQRGQKENKVDAPTVRQDLIERARTGAKSPDGTGAGEEIMAIVDANQQYQGKMKIGIDPHDPNKQIFNIPERIVSGINSIPAHRVVLDASNPQTYQAGLNQLLNDVTGEHVSLSKAVSQHGKGFVQGGVQNPTIKPGQAYKIGGKSYKYEAVEKAAKASGMSVEDYIKEVNK